jgi:hypothetical protein
MNQQPQFLQAQGLQRQPPFVQLQVQVGAVFSIFSMSILPCPESVDSLRTKPL